MGLNIGTGEVINYSNAPEGIQVIDIYMLALDGTGKSERLTFFADYKGYKASNPVVSDDAKFMAFQVAKLGDQAGVGKVILVFDFGKHNK